MTAQNCERIRELNAQGWPDTDIARELGLPRQTITYNRIKLQLPSRRFGCLHRQRCAEQRARYLAEMKVADWPALRWRTHRNYAVECGWPADLRLRHVQILNLLATSPPLSRRSIAAAIGAHPLLQSKDPEGNYLGHLVARGLVIKIEINHPKRLYMLSADALEMLEARNV